MDTLLQDFRFALRQLLRSPGFAIVAALTLALGIGANTAIFSVVNGVLLRPLPWPGSDALVQVLHVTPTSAIVAMSPPDYLDMKEDAAQALTLAGFDNLGYTLTGDGDPLRVVGAATSASFFEVLGVSPALGRGFFDEENEPGRELVTVLSHGLWTDRFGADPSIVGREVRINDVPHTVVGVMPADFEFGAFQLFTPLVYDETFRGGRGQVYLQVIGRLVGGATLAQAEAEVVRTATRLSATYPDSNQNRSARLVPLKEQMIGDVRPALLILLGTVGLVLLIACANVANLLLARGSARSGEIAVRAALGARRSRLVRQLLSESLLLAAVGGALGLLLAFWGTDLLVALQPANVPRLSGVAVDGTVIGFTAGIVLLTAVLFGLAPALQATRPDLVESIKEGGRSAASGGRKSLRSGLVVTEIALAVLLVIGAGLLIRSFSLLQSVEPGFSTEQTIAFTLSLPEANYPEDHQSERFYSDFLERLEALPGVASAGAVLGLPLSGTNITISFSVPGRPEPPPGQSTSLQTRIATPGYFSTIGIPVLEGRAFTEADRADAPQVAILNASAARMIFPDGDPLGERIEMGWYRDYVQVGGEVVGVVGDVRQFGLAEDFVPEIYFPHAQVPTTGMTVIARSEGDPTEIIGAARRELAALDPSLPLWNVRTLEQVLDQSISQPRFYTLLLSIFAGIALVLSAIGIFGVMSYAVTQRTRELGVRLALGATPSHVLALVVRQGGTLVAAGLALGLLGAWAATRLMSSLLYGVTATDATIFMAVPMLLGAVALTACYLPARKASRLDPVAALRGE